MKRKILTILVSMLFITIIPSVMGEIANPEPNDSEPCLDIERVCFRGLVLFPHYSDDNFTFFAVWLSYCKITPTEKNFGLILFKWVKITGRDSLYYGRWYEIRLGPFMFIQLGCSGGLEIA